MDWFCLVKIFVNNNLVPIMIVNDVSDELVVDADHIHASYDGEYESK